MDRRALSISEGIYLDDFVDPVGSCRYSGMILNHGKPLAYYLGKFLELNGIVILTFGLIFGMYRDDLKMEMKMLALGAVVFLVGYLVERKGNRGG